VMSIESVIVFWAMSLVSPSTWVIPLTDPDRDTLRHCKRILFVLAAPFSSCRTGRSCVSLVYLSDYLPIKPFSTIGSGFFFSERILVKVCLRAKGRPVSGLLGMETGVHVPDLYITVS
jgi:hypothetical protein